MEEDNNIKSFSSNIKTYKSYTEPKFISNKKLANSKCLTEINKSKSPKYNSETSKKKKRFPRAISEKVFFDHYDKNNCEYCKGIDNLVQNDKSKLSSFIQNNSNFLHLFGNKRYNRNSPYLFVEDHKCGIDDDRIGLVPIPSKPRIIMKSPDEKNKLYEIQRKIVMIRRFQYGKKNLSEPIFLSIPPNIYNNRSDLYKIILVQKIFKGYIIRKKVEFIMNFKDIIDKWQKILDKIKIRRILRYIFNLELQIVPKADNLKGYDYISKTRKIKQKEGDIYQKDLLIKNKNHKNEEKKIIENSSDNIFKNINNLKKYSKKIVVKERVKNNSPLLTKDYYDIKNTKNKIDKIENNYKKHLDSKKSIIKKENEQGKNNPNGLFIDKIYYSQTAQKIINFNNIMRRALQKAVFRKKTNKDNLELKEEVNNRIDIQPENNKKNYIIKCKIKTNENDAQKIISPKDLVFKKSGFYIDIVRKRNKKLDDKTEQPKKYYEIKNIEINIENENEINQKDEKKNYNLLSNTEFIIPKNEYCYMSKEYKKGIITKENDTKLKLFKELIFDPKERFIFESNMNNEILKEKNEEYSDKLKKAENLFINNKFEIKYSGKGVKMNKTEDKVKVLLIEKNTNFNFLINNKVGENIIHDNSLNNYDITPINNINNNILIKTNKNSIELSHEKIYEFAYEGKEKPILDINKKVDLNMQQVDKIYFEKIQRPIKPDDIKKDFNLNIISNYDKLNIDKIHEFIIESISNINYKRKFFDLKNANNLIIHKIKAFKFIGNKDEKNIILKMEKKDNIKYEGNTDDHKQIKEYIFISEKNNEINFQGLDKIINDEEIKLRQFNKEDIIIRQNDTLTYKGMTIEDSNIKDTEENDEDKENKFITDLYLSQKYSRNICYITKIHKKKDLSEENNKNKKEDNIIKRRDFFISNRPNNNILITKSRYIKYKPVNELKEIIYKKPLFNEFYSYFVQESSVEEESQKLKTKPKKINLNKKDSKNNITPIEQAKNFNSEKSSSSENQPSNNHLTEKVEEDSGLIKTIIPGKGSSETFRIKPNHLLKVIKVAKGKTTYEQYIHVGKLVPKKIREEDEEFIYIRYKSKTPSKSQEKFLKNPLLKKYQDDNEVKKYLPKYKEKGINLKIKRKIKEDENEINNDSNEEKEKNKKPIKLIKIYKFNIKNYCYASKIRKTNNFDESKIQILKDNNKSLSKEKKREDDDDKFIKKEEFRHIIINNHCYCDKVITKKDIYNKFFEYFRNINDNKIYKISMSFKSNNYISKIRLIKNKKEVDNMKESKEELNEKPINKLSFITKKRTNILISPILDRTQLNINKCIITKVKKKNCLTLPDPIYKNELYVITKKRKKIMANEFEELKLPSESINNCFITKERKLTLPKGIPIPSKKVNYINKERKRLIKDSNKIPLKNMYYIEKIRKKDMLNKVHIIQKFFRTKKNKEKNDENLLFNNKDKNAFTPRFKFYSAKGEEKVYNEKNNYDFKCYISKINKIPIYKIYPSDQCYISKEIKFIIKKQNNYSFLSLLDFFIKKNIQEYVFPKLLPDKNNNNDKILYTDYNFDTNKNNIIENSDNFTYPKYYKNIRRIFNFYKTKQRDDYPDSKKIYDEMIPDIKESKSLNDLIVKLNNNSENNNRLIDYEIKEEPNKNIDNNNLIDEIGEFAKFDKNLSNSAFIKNKLKENPDFKNNKNIFNIIKIVDDEYNNLINGKYCFKCGKEILKCKCDDINYIFKETDNVEENENEEDEDNLDFDLDNDEGIETKKINYFEYDANKDRGLHMINKPKLENYLSQSENILQIYNKKQINEINSNRRKNKDDDIKNNSLNLFNNGRSFNKLLNSENRHNQRYSSYSNNNFNNSLNSNNDESNIDNNNKISLSTYNFKK